MPVGMFPWLDDDEDCRGSNEADSLNEVCSPLTDNVVTMSTETQDHRAEEVTCFCVLYHFS